MSDTHNVIASVVSRRALSDPSDSLIPLCARLHLRDELHPELRRRVSRVQDWEHVLQLGEEHGVGPLLYKHLTAGVVRIPRTVERRLRGVYARHRRLNEVILRVLEDILGLLESKGIGVLVLKGPALVSMVYDDPALRPISDLDLLVDEENASHAQQLLGTAGFDVGIPRSPYRISRNHQLPAASRTVDGVPILVEIHVDGLSADRGSHMTYREHRPGARPFVVGGRTAYTLELHAMLWHLCRHMVGLWHPFRLVWAADIIGYAERFADELDWGYLRRAYPFIISTLALLHHLTPLPRTVRERLEGGLHTAPTPASPPAHVCLDYTGWPRSTAFVWDSAAERAHMLRRTVMPPDWWLRLNYGTGPGRWGRYSALPRHMRALGGIVARRAGDMFPWRV